MDPEKAITLAVSIGDSLEEESQASVVFLESTKASAASVTDTLSSSSIVPKNGKLTDFDMNTETTVSTAVEKQEVSSEKNLRLKAVLFLV